MIYRLINHVYVTEEKFCRIDTGNLPIVAGSHYHTHCDSRVREVCRDHGHNEIVRDYLLAGRLVRRVTSALRRSATGRWHFSDVLNKSWIKKMRHEQKEHKSNEGFMKTELSWQVIDLGVEQWKCSRLKQSITWQTRGRGHTNPSLCEPSTSHCWKLWHLTWTATTLSFVRRMLHRQLEVD